MISGRQIREGRALLEWSISDVAECARIDVKVVMRAEIFEGKPFIGVAENSAIRRALEAVGVEFIPGAGARLRGAEA